MLVTLMMLACLVGVWRASFVAVDLNNCGIDRILMDSPDDAWLSLAGNRSTIRTSLHIGWVTAS